MLAGIGREAEIKLDLAEWGYGDYEGKLSSDIRQTRSSKMAFEAVALFCYQVKKCIGTITTDEASMIAPSTPSSSSTSHRWLGTQTPNSQLTQEAQ